MAETKPWLLSREAQDISSENRGGDQGSEQFDVDFTAMSTAKAQKIFSGRHYGFAIMSFSTAGLTGVTIFTARPRGGVNGYPVKVGLTIKAKADEPVSEEIWIKNTAGAQAIVVRIAVFLTPSEATQYQQIILSDPDGTQANVRNADADDDFAATLAGLIVNSRLSAYDAAAADFRRLHAVDGSGGAPVAHASQKALIVSGQTCGRDSSTWKPIEANNADATADFAKTLIGLLINARIAAYSNTAADWTRLLADRPSDINSEASNSASLLWMRTAAAAFGRDTSDNTMRAIETRVSGSAAARTEASLYRLCVDATIRGYQIGNSGASSPAAVLSTMATALPDANAFLCALAAEAKRDVAGAAVVPTPMVRTAQAAAVAPAAAVIATLDAQGLTNKAFMLQDTAVGAYDIEVSYDGTTYMVPYAGIATVIGINTPTAVQMELLKAFRYFRLRGTSAGTQTAQLSAMGA